MVEVKLNTQNENPFFGLRNCLKIFQLAGTANSRISDSMLNDAWNEVKNDKTKREMFFSLLFSIGDITARQHNIFGNVVRDSGGNSNREMFYHIFNWLKVNHYKQFVKFMHNGLFNEYTCFDLLFRSRVKTVGSKVVEIYDSFADEEYCTVLLDYCYKIVNGTNAFNKLLLAKFLTIPRLTKRQGHSKMLPATLTVMRNKAHFLAKLSQLCGWEYKFVGNYANFSGYRKWRKEFNSDLESVLFSTGTINDFSKDEFMKWFNQLPSQARFRVKNRIVYKTNDDGTEKYPLLKVWYNEWEAYKASKQAEQRVLEEKVRQGQASDKDMIKLKQVKKDAKVTVGATSFNEIYDSICRAKEDPLKIESFMNKVNLPYNTLVIVDDSGSMSGEPFRFASFIASVCLTKNPDDDGRNLLGMFNTSSRLYSYIDTATAKSYNSIIRTTSTKVAPEPFVNPTASFMDNYRRISSFMNSAFRSGGTHINSIPQGFAEMCRKNPGIKDALMNYPVWTIISDGEWNNLYSPESSLNQFFRECVNLLGFKPFIIAIDINRYLMNSQVKIDRFSGIDNFMYIPSNPAQIEQFLTNFKDMDMFDIYTPLQSIYRSNRYDVVRVNTL